MPWNEQNDSNNPWGNKRPRPNQPPPDIDEVIRKAQERFQSVFGNRGGGSGGGSGFERAMLPLFLVLLFVGWVLSGFYVVAADEQAVVLRFGKYIATNGPGLHWRFPRPIAEDIKVPVTRVQRLEIGFRGMGEGRPPRKKVEESLMLTKDENIVDISFIVQYKVKDVADYLFNIDERKEETVRDAAESAIREVIGRTMIDDVLTTKKAEVEVETADLIQSILDTYESGISVSTVKLQDVQPPERVIKEFKDVASAREDKERAKNEAQAYANDITPKARGEAKKMVLDAEGYQAALIDKAKGEADRFNRILRAYRENPKVTRKRLYLETMEEVLAKADKVIVDKTVASKVLPYLPLNRAGKVEVK